MNKLLYLVAVLLFLTSCDNNEPDPGEPLLYPELNEEFSGGSATTFVGGFNAFEIKVSGMSQGNRRLFALGNSLFEQSWVTAPASTVALDGLGPFFNAVSCASCHFKDGRGRPPLTIDEVGHGLLVQLSTNGLDEHGNPLPHPVYGGQFQDQSIMGLSPKGRVVINTELISGTYDDGVAYSLANPVYTFDNLGYGEMNNLLFSPRVAPHMVGLGLLDAIPDETILANADEGDANQDGISGRAIYVWNLEEQMYTLGKYGWKSSAPTIKQQVATAFSFDMGLTTSLFPEGRCPEGVDCDAIPNGGEPEVPNDRLNQVSIYSSTLAVPVRRDYDDQDVLKGKQLFNEMDCAKCHLPIITTGDYPSIPQLANQTIRPYTDMLLHDMGEDLSDHRPAPGGAQGNEWRTPPLWGIGLFQEVNGHTRYLHDGRARNIEEAILWHGGEAENSKNKFKALSAEEREQVLKFLNSL